jgi:hypothetical protein
MMCFSTFTSFSASASPIVHDIRFCSENNSEILLSVTPTLYFLSLSPHYIVYCTFYLRRVPADKKGPLDTFWKIRDTEGYVLNYDGSRSACVHQWDRWHDELHKFVDTKLF